MDILRATLRDLGPLRRIEQACFLKDAWPLLDLLAVLTWPEVVRLKAVEDGQMIGFIAGDPRPSDHQAWIATVGVLPEYQRRGIGRALLRECEQRLTQPRIRLCVRVSNESAIRLYQQEGYLAMDTWREYYNDKENALVMEKIR
ncbi:MAG: GNAT family N-acetyltransferase [Candidatus Atribacteria bacterium]|jgi:ribosomal-protein-alanine N-acetyltransferase|nr:GNAT family N-acetyltransferase [Candidatus Atribacteria bacterium]